MGKFLNEYEELKLLGKGSSAKIYKVRHLELDYIRAIRVLNETVSDNDNDNKVYQSFIQECKVLLKLGNGGHPNIVRIYQPRKLQNHALVEMDFIDGCDLDDYLRERRGFIPVDEVMRFVYEIGSALAYCHVDCYEYLYDKNKEYNYQLESELKGQKFRIGSDPNNGKKDLITPLQKKELIREYGITHNDIHSKNIMRKRYDGSYILLDFGLAIQDGKAIKSSSRRDGAVEYKAPEKWDRKGVISERSDIYGFGIILYEMLAGRVPFPFQREKYSKEEEALFKLSLDHEKTPPPPIESLRRAAFEAIHNGETYKKDYPDWLEQVIMKCLSKSPEDRYADGKDLFSEIKKHHNSQIKSEEQDKKENSDTTLTVRINELEKEKHEFDSQMNSLARQLARAAFDAEKSLKEKSDLKEELQNLRKEHNNFNDNNKNLSEKIIVLSGENENLLKQVMVLSDKNEKSEKFYTDLQAQVEEKEGKNQALFSELNNVKAEHGDLKEKSANLSKQIVALSEKNESLSKHVAALSGKNEKSEKLSNELQAQLEGKEDNIQILFTELNNVKNERNNLKDKSASLSEQIVTLSGKNENLSKQITVLSEEKEKAVSLTNSLQIQLTEEEKNANVLSNELLNQRKERDVLKEKSESLSKQLTVLSEEKAKSEKLGNELHIKLIEAEDYSRDLFSELDNVKNERDDLKEKSTSLSEQIVTLSGKNENLSKRLSGLSEEREKVVRLSNDLQIQLAEEEKNANALSNELVNQRKERDVLKEKSENLSKQIAVLSDEKEKNLKQINDLQSQLTVGEKDLKAVSVELKSLKKERDDFKKEQDDLKSKNEKLSKQIKDHPNNPTTSRLWKVTTGIAAMLAVAAMLYAYIYNPTSENVDPNNYETTISQQKTAIDNLQSEKSELQNNLNDANTTIDQLKQQASSVGETNTDDSIKKQQEIEKLKKENNALKSSVNDRDRTISRQKEEINTAQKTIDNLLK